MAKRKRPARPTKSVRKRSVAAAKKVAEPKPTPAPKRTRPKRPLPREEPELITIQQAADLGSLSITTIKRLVRKRKHGEPRCPFGVTHIGRAVRIHRHEYITAINNGIPHV